MQYTKTMIDLVFQIRKNAPSAVRPQIKLTSPTLLDTLIELYGTVSNSELQALIYELLSHVGQEWVASITAPSTTEPNNKPQPSPTQTKRLAETPPHPSTKEKVVTYRGQRIVVPA